MNTSSFTRHIGALSVLFLLDACAADVADDVGVAEQEIKAGSPASGYYAIRSAVFSNCTGTVVGPQHVLTAAHCKKAVNDTVSFFSSYSSHEETRYIESVAVRPGVYPSSDDFTDTNGKFADIAVIKVRGNIPCYSRAATMRWVYPTGGDDWGVRVGAGCHDDNCSLFGQLRMNSDYTYSDKDSDGHFLLENSEADSGDSGGGFYYGSNLLGVLYGSVFEWEYRNKYTSVPYHLPWILDTMSYTWPGSSEQAGLRRSGTLLTTTITASQRVCQYICDKTASCVAYNRTPFLGSLSMCSLLSSVTTTQADALYSSASK